MKITRQKLLELGFSELPHRNIGNNLFLDLPRGIQITVSCIASPNEMVWICQRDILDAKKKTDLICFRNFDYHGYTDLIDIVTLINLFSQ